LVYVAAVVIPLNICRAKVEEKVLLEQLGDVYKNYKDSTLC
jgi:protein-S-isoprenylcysteine O-methyltransferase Ste14